MISEKPTEIVLRRNRAALGAQTVRIEYANTGSTIRGREDSTSLSTKRGVIVFGVKDHPTEPDLDIQSQDQFTVDNQNFRVIDVVHTVGSIQAFADAQS